MRHVIIGGGIAGVCCVEELCRIAPEDTVVLISASTVLKVRSARPAANPRPSSRACTLRTCIAADGSCSCQCMCSSLPRTLAVVVQCWSDGCNSDFSHNTQGVDAVIKITKTIEEVLG
jgi:hypothetical protein